MRRASSWTLAPALLAMGLALAPARLALAAEPSPVAVQARPVSAFLATIGVNTHMNYTDGAYAHVDEAIADLDYLGIHLLRDPAPDPGGGIPSRNHAAAIDALAKRGNRFNFLTGSDGKAAVAVIEAVERAHPGTVVAVEGVNEINNQPVTYKAPTGEELTGEAAAKATQRALYAAVKASPVIGHVPVYLYTGGTAIDLKAETGLADVANAHPYPYRGEPPGPRIKDEPDEMFGSFFPRVLTETGYYSNPLNPFGSGVDEATQAKLTLDLLLSSYAQGNAATYLYQLRSPYPDAKGIDTDTEYGLFNLDNSPKPVATALHNLTAILHDDAAGNATFEPGKLAFALTGMPTAGHHVLLQKASGPFLLVLWAEPLIWNEAKHTPVPAPVSEVGVTLAAPAPSIRVFDPLTGTAAIAHATDAAAVRVALTDHPVIVEIGTR